MRVEIVAFPGFDEVDALGPLEVLRNAAKGGADWDVALVGLHDDSDLTGAHGLRVGLDGVLSEHSDLVVVPGGGWNDHSPRGARAEAQRGALPAALAAAHQRGAVTAGVCTGVMILAAAGLTRNRPAVTHHGAIDELAASGALVRPDARVVDDEGVVTCGGVTSGLDLALWLVERYHGRRLADGVAREIEHSRVGTVVTRQGARSAG